MLNVRLGLFGQLLIEEQVLLPQHVNLSLGLGVLLLHLIEIKITSSTKTSHARRR